MTTPMSGRHSEPQPQPRQAQPWQQPPHPGPGAAPVQDPRAEAVVPHDGYGTVLHGPGEVPRQADVPAPQGPGPMPGTGGAPAGAPAAPAAPGTSGAHAAPVRTGSPIIAPGLLPALVTTALCALLALASQVSQTLLVVPVVLLQAVTAAGWFRLNGMWPARQGIALAFLAGLAADAGLLLLGDGPERAAAVLVGTLAIWIAPVLVLQMRHRGAADERLYALTVTVSATVVTVLAGALAAPWPSGPEGSGDAVLTAVAAVAAAVVVRGLPLPAAAAAVLAAAAAAGSGAALDGVRGAVLGLTAGLCALAGLRVASYDFPSRFVHFTAGVSLPLALAAPAVPVVAGMLEHFGG
ncbi:hypothetical protein ACFV1B_10455 [Streptomyces sp. NPDC059637]|uniref:hypothetical protein n=1 Tax=Streptomyces sp. NPDC059637 TaxID=3347752 RepID=UPI0036B98051